MFLKLRKGRAAVPLLLSLVFFAASLVLFLSSGYGPPSSPVGEPTAMPDQTVPGQGATDAAPTEGYTEEEPVPSVPAVSETGTDAPPTTRPSSVVPTGGAPGTTGQGAAEAPVTDEHAATIEPAPVRSEKNSLFAAVALILFGLSLFFAVAFVTGKREKSACSPEGALGLFAAAVPFTVHAFEGGRLSFVPAFFCLLLGLRWTVRWLKSREKTETLLSRRLAKALFADEGRRLRFFAVLSPVGLLSGAGAFVLLRDLRLVVFAPAVFLLALGVTAQVSLLCTGRSLSALEEQIRALSSGEETSPDGGVFAEESAALSSLGAAVKDAVDRAVKDERFKVELIANVSHDLRTPLTAIVGYADLLKTEDLSEKGREELDRLSARAAYMRALVDDLFELTKVSAGQIVPEKTELDLVRLLRQTLAMHEEGLAEKGLTLREELPEVCPVVTDGARLHRVFDNLVLNAVKYAMPGTRFFVRLTETDGRVTVRFVNVSATELDFSPEEITERFARGDRTRSTPGSGLGLAIAKTYTEALGGSFFIEIDGDVFTAVVALQKA